MSFTRLKDLVEDYENKLEDWYDDEPMTDSLRRDCLEEAISKKINPSLNKLAFAAYLVQFVDFDFPEMEEMDSVFGKLEEAILKGEAIFRVNRHMTPEHCLKYSKAAEILLEMAWINPERFKDDPFWSEM